MKTTIDKLLSVLVDEFIEIQSFVMTRPQIEKMVRLNLGGTKITLKNYFALLDDISNFDGIDYKFSRKDIKKILVKRIELTKDYRLSMVLEKLNKIK